MGVDEAVQLVREEGAHGACVTHFCTVLSAQGDTARVCVAIHADSRLCLHCSGNGHYKFGGCLLRGCAKIQASRHAPGWERSLGYGTDVSWDALVAWYQHLSQQSHIAIDRVLLTLGQFLRRHFSASLMLHLKWRKWTDALYDIDWCCGRHTDEAHPVRGGGGQEAHERHLVEGAAHGEQIHEHKHHLVAEQAGLVGHGHLGILEAHERGVDGEGRLDGVVDGVEGDHYREYVHAIPAHPEHEGRHHEVLSR